MVGYGAARLTHPTLPPSSLGQCLLNEFRWIRPESTQQPVMFGVFNTNRFETLFRDLQQLRLRISHQERRMGRHNHLANRRTLHRTQQLQKLDLAGRRQSGFRLIKDEDALAPTAFGEEAQKASPCECERKSGGVPP